ncbi:MAG: Trm112 family protein [Proteobacteria bacterium]|nr:Trm112 family protein [Pseudomonadota bacterium]
MAVDPKLLELLVCPLTKTPLRFEQAKGELVSDAAGLAFPIRDGVPVMIVSEARSLEEAERRK